jgi:DNA-binding phage protein
MSKFRFKSALAAACALWLLGYPLEASAQQISTLPLSIQLNLRAAAAQGNPQLLNAVRQAVAANPKMAQSIVNQAAALKPSLSSELVTTANQTLRGAEVTRRLQDISKRGGANRVDSPRLPMRLVFQPEKCLLVAPWRWEPPPVSRSP